MPDEEVLAPSVPAAEDSDISLAEYRKQRTEAPAAVPEKSEEPAKTAPVTETGKEEEKIEDEEAGKDDKPKGGFQRRIDKLTREKAELERKYESEVTDLRGRLEALETRKPEVKAEAKTEGDPEPKEEDYKDYKAFAKDLARWVTRQELKAANEATEKASREQVEKDSQAARKQQFDKYLGEMSTVKASKTDFDDVFADVQFPDYIHNRLVRMEKGAEIAYALAKDKAALKKILDLNAEALRRGDSDFTEAYWEFGAFVRSLNNPSSPPKAEKPVSKAPAPISPLAGGGGKNEPDFESDEVSLAEYRRRRAR